MQGDYLIKMILMECPLCDDEHEVEERERNVNVTIKGEKVEYKERYFLCKKSDEDENEFASAKLTDTNMVNARNSYRIKKGLLTSDEIIQIRERYGLSQSDLANLLGWGEITITRYESKSIQDEAYDNVLRIIKENPMEAYLFLEKNKLRFGGLKYLSIREKIIQNLDEFGKEFLKRQVLEIEYVHYRMPSDFNGNKSLNIDKLENVISYIAKRVGSLYKVKLMKLLWYSDALNYKINGEAMTGLVYCHDALGALPIAHYKILDLENVIVDKEEDYDCIKYRIMPNDKMDFSNLDAKDMDILDQIIHKFKNYNANEIVQYMHDEKAYLETQEKQIIPFCLAGQIRDF